MMLSSLVGRKTFWKIFLSALILLGLYVAFIRFFFGLGAATNLSNDYPWGLWIGFDLLVGVGLAAGGFVIAATVHIFGIKEYKPIARPAILTAFLGYLLVIVALLFDLGQPWRIWHCLIMWNHHSVMFEVAWCVMLYTTVLALEFSPVLFERLGWNVPLRIVRMIYIPLVIAGVLLSTMHQSSLGSLYVIAPEKLHGLWYTSMLPVLFFTSSVAAGLTMTIFESYMSARAFGKRLESKLLRGLARAAVVVLSCYTLIRFNDLLLNNALGLAFTFSMESTMFWAEMGIGVILPAVLFASRRVRHNQNGLFFASILTILGFILNRLNVSITGWQSSLGSGYFPSWMEIVVTSCIVGAGFVAFALAVKYLNIFQHHDEVEPAVQTAQLRSVTGHKPVIGGPVLAWVWVLFLILGSVALVSFLNNPSEASQDEITTAADVEIVPTGDHNLLLPTDYTFPMGEDSEGPVTFSHATHVSVTGSKPNCDRCHPTLFRLDERGAPAMGELTYERIHEGHLCYSCHNGEESFHVEDDCSDCHQ